MSIAFVASVAASSGTTGTMDTTGANFLVVVIADQDSLDTNGVSDSKSNTWVQLTVYPSPHGVCIFYSVNPTVGTLHTFTISGATFASIAAAAFSGVHATAPLDQQAGASGTQSGSVTPSENNELVIAGAYSDGANPTSADGGFTTPNAANVSGNHAGYGLAYLIQTTAAAANPSWGAGTDSAAIATFKQAAAAGSVKTVQGVAFASVKTVNGVAIASVKTINGVATA